MKRVLGFVITLAAVVASGCVSALFVFMFGAGAAGLVAILFIGVGAFTPERPFALTLALLFGLLNYEYGWSVAVLITASSVGGTSLGWFLRNGGKALPPEPQKS